MWLCPPSIRSLGVHLPDGSHLLPGGYSEIERACLIGLLRGAVPVDTACFELSDIGADEAIRLGALFTNSLVLVHLDKHYDDLGARVLSLTSLGARYLLVQPTVGSEGTAWLEGLLKVPLMNWVRQQLRSPVHPLASFHVARLDIYEVASQTTDPFMFIRLVERTVDHRLSFAAVGLEEVDWARSLRVCAARVLDRRSNLESESRSLTQQSAQKFRDRILHFARELPLICIATAWRTEWSESANSRRKAPLGDKVLGNRIEELVFRRVGAPNERRNFARDEEDGWTPETTARVQEKLSSRDIVVIQQASFLMEVVAFFTAEIGEVLSDSKRWIGLALAWIDDKRQLAWQRFCVGNIAIALASLLLRCRRSPRDILDARSLLSKLGKLPPPVYDPVPQLRCVCDFSVLGRDVRSLGRSVSIERKEEVFALLKFISNIVEGKPLVSRSYGDSGIETLASIIQWRNILRGRRPLTGAVTGPEFAVLRPTELVFCGELDEGLGELSRLQSLGSNCPPITLAFAWELAGVAQWIRGDVDRSVEALMRGSDIYAALGDSERLRHVAATIDLVRSGQ